MSLDKLKNLADRIEEKKEEISATLAYYQPHEVTLDEIENSKETLLTVDGQWLGESIAMIATFMSSNLPLYSLVLFGIIPALISREVHIKVNQVMLKFSILSELMKILDIKKYFPHIYLHSMNRNAFISEIVGNSDAVIFTGKPRNASKIIESMKIGSIMIANCSGHNPLVITESANIDQAVKDAVHVRGYNCGQDCAAPDAILIHKNIAEEFITKFIKAFTELKMGDYGHYETKIGPIPRFEDLQELSKFLYENKHFIIANGYIDYQKSIVSPTVLHSLLTEKINYEEIFAPAAFLHTYNCEEELDLYFNDKDGNYRRNKMYVSLYGHSDYVMQRNDFELPEHNGIGIVIHNKTIHHIENGNQPFGGYSVDGSCVIKRTLEGIIRIPKPTLVLRDIKHYLIDDKPVMLEAKAKPLKNEAIEITIFKDTIRHIFSDKFLFAYMWEDETVKQKNIFVCLDNEISDREKILFAAQLEQSNKKNNINQNGEIFLIRLEDMDNFCHDEVARILSKKKIGFVGDGRLLSAKIKEHKLNLISSRRIA